MWQYTPHTHTYTTHFTFWVTRYMYAATNRAMAAKNPHNIPCNVWFWYSTAASVANAKNMIPHALDNIECIPSIYVSSNEFKLKYVGVFEIENWWDSQVSTPSIWFCFTPSKMLDFFGIVKYAVTACTWIAVSTKFCGVWPSYHTWSRNINWFV